MRVLIFILVFLLLGVFYIISVNNIALINPGSINVLASKYLAWFPKLMENFDKTTAYVIKLDWMP